MPQPRLVALDWGTTSLRAWLLGDEARILDGRRRARGLQGTGSDDSKVRTSAYQRVFDEAIGDWLRANPALPVLGCGMVGSAQGWKDARYGPIGAQFCRLAVAESIRVGAWGTIVCSNAAPQHAMWDDIALQQQCNQAFVTGSLIAAHKTTLLHH